MQDKIGELLIKNKLITESQFNEALEKQQEFPCVPIGQILCQLGFLSAADLNMVLDYNRKRLMLGEILIRQKQIDETKLKNALNKAAKERVPLGQALMRLNYLDEEKLAQAIAAQFDLLFLPMEKFSFDPELARLLCEDPIGGGNGNISPIDLFSMGGTGLGYINTTPLRGYEDQSIGPRRDLHVCRRHVGNVASTRVDFRDLLRRHIEPDDAVARFAHLDREGQTDVAQTHDAEYCAPVAQSLFESHTLPSALQALCGSRRGGTKTRLSYRKHGLARRRELTADGGCCRAETDAGTRLRDLDFEAQNVSRTHLPLEAHFVDACEERELSLVLPGDSPCAVCRNRSQDLCAALDDRPTVVPDRGVASDELVYCL